MARKNIAISELDFDGIKQNLKDYLVSQSEFTDYDFEGSGINILLDLLAANTHYMGFYASMVASEAFLDTASTRNSVVSLAKQLGYTPRSVISPKALVNINFGTTRPTLGGIEFDYLPIGTIFSATIDRTTYNFITTKQYKLLMNDSLQYYINDVEIVEGVISNTSFIVDETNSDQRFVLPSNKIDTNTLVVRVQTSVTDISGFEEKWSINSDFSALSSDSRVFFLDEVEDGRFALYFGDGIIGRKLRHGNLVTVQYLVTNGTLANGIGNKDNDNKRSFSIPSIPSAVVVVTSPSSGGSPPESISSIKFNAPRNYQAQNRAVTKNDYRAIILENYGDIDSVYVYGGEDASPPEYGKVFVAIKPKNGETLTAIEKANITKNIIGPRNVLGITPQIVDPDMMYLNVTTNVTYDPSQTSKSPGDIESIVKTIIFLFSEAILNKFDVGLIHSQFTSFIDDANVSIIGNETSIILEKRLVVKLGEKSSYELDYNNPMHHPEEGYKSVISSDGFDYFNGTTTTTAYFDDDGNGLLRIYEIVDSTKKYISTNIGTVDYTEGSINIIDFNPPGILGNEATIKIKVIPNNFNILSKRNTILTIDSSDINSVSVTANPKTVIDDGSISGTPFPYTNTE